MNLNDFREFKTAFSAPGGGGLGDGGGTVPEPATWALALLASAAFYGARARTRVEPLGTGAASRLAGLAIAIVLAGAATASADLLVYDPFLIGVPGPGEPEYTAGYIDPTTAAGGGQNPGNLGTDQAFFNGGWHRRTNGDAPRAAAQAPGLFYLDPNNAQGGSLFVDRVSAGPDGTTSIDARTSRRLATTWGATDATFYVSWVVNFGAVTPAITDLGYRALEFWDETTMPNTGDADIWVAYSAYNGPPPPRTPSTARMHLHSGGGDTILSNAPDNFNADGANHLVVVKFVLDDAAASDSISVFLDPITLTEPGVASAQHTGLDLTINNIGFAMYGSAGSTPIIVDELRIATTYIDSLPELPVPGDTNGDDLVDNVDFTTILNNMGRFDVIGGPAEGDVAFSNGKQGSDGKVDLGDMWIWKRNEAIFGAGGGGNAIVPEPAGLLLAVSATLALVGTRRPRRTCLEK